MRRPLLLMASLCSALLSHAQLPTIDMTMSDNGQGQLEFRIRSSEHYDEIMSGLTFTVRWPAAAGIALDTAVRCYPFQDVVPVNAVAVATNGEYMYRTFNGFSIMMLSDIGYAWEAGMEYAIATADILVPGTQFELVDDSWTDANNRSFFCSLGGLERTGSYYTSAMPLVDILMTEPGTGSVQVHLLPQENFFGWVTDLTFTLRWNAASGAHLGNIVQDSSVYAYLPIEKIGDEVTVGAYRYQRFHGTGVKSIANAGEAWLANVPEQVMAIPVLGAPTGLQVVNDAWTGSSGGDFSITLNGQDRTQSITTGIADLTPNGTGLSVMCEPSGLRVQSRIGTADDHAHIELFTPLGQRLWQRSLQNTTGTLNVLVDPPMVNEGVYILAVSCGDRTWVQRIFR